MRRFILSARAALNQKQTNGCLDENARCCIEINTSKVRQFLCRRKWKKRRRGRTPDVFIWCVYVTVARASREGTIERRRCWTRARTCPRDLQLTIIQQLSCLIEIENYVPPMCLNRRATVGPHKREHFPQDTHNQTHPMPESFTRKRNRRRINVRRKTQRDTNGLRTWCVQ